MKDKASSVIVEVAVCEKTSKKRLTSGRQCGNITKSLRNSAVQPLARVVELVDSLASGASARKGVRVRLPPRAPSEYPLGYSDFLLRNCSVIVLQKCATFGLFLPIYEEGMQGWICDERNIENSWLVNFPQYGEKDDIATIAIQEEDLHLLPDGMHAVVNEEIKAQFDVLENGKKWGMFPAIWFECIKHPAGCLKSLILPGLHNPLMTLGPKRKTRHKSCLSFWVSAF